MTANSKREIKIPLHKNIISGSADNKNRQGVNFQRITNTLSKKTLIKYIILQNLSLNSTSL